MKYYLASIILILSMVAILGVASAETSSETIVPDQVLRLWPGDAPGLVVPTRSTESVDERGNLRNISAPEMWVYLSKKSVSKSPVIMICPGGGFAGLGMTLHVRNVVKLFNDKGIVVIGLKYRTSYGGNDYVKDSLADCERGIRLIRLHAADWGIDPNQICAQGYSAGGTVCMNLLGNFDTGNAAATDPVERLSSRPDFVALMCPWPNKKTANDYPILKNPPPVFIASAEDDTTAPTLFAREIGTALIKQGGKVEWFIVPTGGHGAFHYGVSKSPGAVWPSVFEPWLLVHP